jgi:S1-C subfamily serine protease
VNGHPVNDIAEFESICEELKKLHAQDAIALTLIRQGREVNIKITP